MADQIFRVRSDKLEVYDVLKRTPKQLLIKQVNGRTNTIRATHLGDAFFESELDAWLHEEQRLKDCIADHQKSIQFFRGALGTAEKMRARAARAV